MHACTAHVFAEVWQKIRDEVSDKKWSPHFGPDLPRPNGFYLQFPPFHYSWAKLTQTSNQWIADPCITLDEQQCTHITHVRFQLFLLTIGQVFVWYKESVDFAWFIFSNEKVYPVNCCWTDQAVLYYSHWEFSSCALQNVLLVSDPVTER